MGLVSKRKELSDKPATATYCRGEKYVAYLVDGVAGIVCSACRRWLRTPAARFADWLLTQSGSVLPGAKVTLSNVNTGVITAKPTDNAGIYVFDFVEPGTYTITVEAGGFARHVQENIVVQSGSRVNCRRYA